NHKKGHEIIKVKNERFVSETEEEKKKKKRKENCERNLHNYIARRYGVRAGLPGFLGKKLCPQLKIIPCDFAKYIATSRVVQDSCESDVIPFSAVSLDEAYLDLTDHLTERCEFPVERRTFWPRSAPGAPMLVSITLDII
ncbi:unnamed protein product, partial [Trichobilharzia regenti]